MRLCRFAHAQQPRWGLFDEQTVTVVDRLVSEKLGWPPGQSWEWALPVGSPHWSALLEYLDQLQTNPAENGPAENVERLWTSDVHFLPPIADPPKLLLLAGNYAEHVREQGGIAAEKERTFPYVFMKPPSTTLVGSGTPFKIPALSPNKLDHEVELAVIIGQRLRSASTREAQQAIAGYTIVNDISDRGFRPNPNRETRPRDSFFDWLHGKWHDGSCPCGPSILLADAAVNPQRLSLTLSIGGEIRQQGSTSQMVLSVVELIEFISSFVTLEPGDIISTGTPAGVGNATGRYLKAGQTMVAKIESIGELITPIVD